MAADFVSAAHFRELVFAAPFFERLTPQDLLARGAASATGYRAAYAAAFAEPEPADREDVALALAAGRAAHGAAHPALFAEPWRLALVDDAVEGGLAHTLGDTILLPWSFRDAYCGGAAAGSDLTRPLWKLLLHERVHVLQRRDPAWAARAAGTRGMRAVPLALVPHARANPDDNGALYLGPDGAGVACVYDSARPASLRDARVRRVTVLDGIARVGDPADAPAARVHEHPYEAHASLVADMLPI